MSAAKRIEIEDTIWKDERGWGLNPFVSGHFVPDGHCDSHVVSMKPGVVRGNHYHTNGTERMLICGGPARILSRSITEETVQVMMADGWMPLLIEIPAHVEHAVRNESNGDIYLVVFSDIPAPGTFAADPSLCEYYGGYLLMAKHDYPDVPRVGVGAVVIKDGRVLLVRRGIPPSEGLWAIPGGHVELGETLQETAEREILEETGVVVTARNPIYTFDLIERDKSGRIRFHYIVVDVKADYVSGEPRGSDDALEARWLSWDEIRELPVSNNTIKLLKSIKFAL